MFNLFITFLALWQLAQSVYVPDLSYCQPLTCQLNCQYGLAVDNNGCKICECVDPCKNITCDYGYKCQCSTIQCLSAPCPPPITPKCVKVCETLQCQLNCIYGFEIDVNGCKLCKCIDPCMTIKCSPGYKCQCSDIQCLRTPCPLPVPPKCVKVCEPFQCDINCIYGYATDVDGCKLCKCFDPCTTTKCELGYKCQCSDIQCLKSPCPLPVPPKCIKECPLTECKIRCASGYATDDNGCKLCECNDPCEGVQCYPGSVCKVTEVMPECPSAICAPIISAQCLPESISTGNYDCDDNSPCTESNRRLGLYYFPSQISGKFIQCSDFGDCFVMPCAPGLVWNVDAYTCTYPESQGNP